MRTGKLDPDANDTGSGMETEEYGSYRFREEPVTEWWHQAANPANFRVQSTTTIPTSNRDHPSITRSSIVENGEEQDLAEYAEQEKATIIADRKPSTQNSDECSLEQVPQGNLRDEYPLDEPPRIAPVPVLGDLEMRIKFQKPVPDDQHFDPPAASPVPNLDDAALRNKQKTRKDDYYSDPPATLIIRSFQARSAPFGSHDDLSDISPILDCLGGTDDPSQKDRAMESTTSSTVQNSDTTLIEDAQVPHDPEKGCMQVKSFSEAPQGKHYSKKTQTIHLIFAGLLFMFVCCSTGYLIVYFINFAKNISGSSSQFVGNKATTPMDPFEPGCTFQSHTQPHVIGQCTCTGTISVMADDVEEKYYALRSFLTSLNATGAWTLTSEDSCDPSNQAMVWLATSYAKDQDDLVQKYLLASFFIQMHGEQWLNKEGWLYDEDKCRWSGVACDDEGLVRHIYLDGNGLQGPIPGRLAYLQSLESLSLQNNAITGEIPSTIFTLPGLKQLSLSGNMLSGIPSGLGMASNLEVLQLDMNSIEWALPLELFRLTSLRELNLEQNRRITGRLDAAIGNLQNVEVMSFSDTSVQSRVPAELGLLTNLRVLKMADTQLSGTIPEEVALLTSLIHLDLSGSKFRRSIPKTLGNLRSLEYLSLNNNELTGRIPFELGFLSSLLHLDLSSNMFFGEVPSSLGSLTLLDTLTLQDNALTGRAPAEVCDLRRHEMIVFTTDCSDGSEGVLCPVPSCCTKCSTKKGLPA